MRSAKITQLQLPVSGEEEVGRFEITMATTEMMKSPHATASRTEECNVH
jgi:hypothetical protein